ncbi:MAG: dihydropteroate synthase [Candidatus Thorarchaeota archaeon]
MRGNSITINGVGFGGSNPVRIMGVINLSPESFYKGSIPEEGQLVDFTRKLLQTEPDVIDIGGASTAPKDVYGTSSVAIEKEISRVKKALESIIDLVDKPISIDTTSSKVAEVALDMGVDIINDVSGLRADEKMAALVADRDVPLIIMSNCTSPCDSIEGSLNALRRSIKIAEETGIANEKIILDPGIGFGKPPEVDFAILRELKQFKLLGRPLLVGVSRKAFIGFCLDEPNPKDRLSGTIATTSIAVVNGADVIRTHDVEEAKIASRIGEAVRFPNDKVIQ